MELRVLRYFLAVAREQNISAAAQSLHLTQPTLSRQLKELEDSLGKQLMIRGNRKITLTEDGMILRKRAEEILDLVGRTEKEIMYSDETVSGDLYIGTGETDGVRQIARTANQIQKTYPNLHFHIVSGDAVDVCERLDKGLLDFGILLGDIDKTKYNYMELPMKDVWGILMQRSSPLAQKSTISPQDLWDKPLILSRQAGNKSGLYRWLQKDPMELHTVATYNLIYNASLMVDEGMGYAFTLDKLVNTSGSHLCFRRLNPQLELDMYLVWKKYQIFSKPAEAFFQKLKENLKEDKFFMQNAEVIYQYLLQYSDCTDHSDEAIERSNHALNSLMDLLDTAKEEDIFSPQDIPALCNIILKMEVELEDEHSYHIEWSVKDQILKRIMSLICIDGVSVWGDTLAQTINQYRQVNREYIKVAVEHLLSFFLFGKTSEDEKARIENRIAFLEALQRNISDYWQLLISYCEAYIAEWSENYDITPEDRNQLEAVALQTNWDTNQFCLHFYDPEADKSSATYKQQRHLLEAALHLNLPLYQFYEFLHKKNNDEIDFRKVSFLSEW